VNDSRNVYYVYQFLRAKDSSNGSAGSPYYVGKGMGPRAFVTRRGIAVPTDRARIRFIATDMTELEAFALEIAQIKLYGRIDLGTGILRNKTNGGEGFTESARSPEANEKRRAALLGRKRPPRSEKWKENLSKSLRGRPCSVEAAKHLSALFKGRKRPHVMDMLIGVPRAKDVRERISQTLTGHSVSKETRDKLSKAFKGKPLAEETKKKMSLAQFARQQKERQSVTF
jgi:hypothetical protein